MNLAGQIIPLHGILECLGIFIAFRYHLHLRKKHHDIISQKRRIIVIIAATFGAVIGSRVIGALENLPVWIHSDNPWQYFWYNKTLVGGLLGGLAGVETAKRLIGETKNTGDLFTYPLILGMIIGRLGCFSAGVFEETYGVPSHLPWAMDLGDGVLRHPVTLYEITALIMIWIVLKKVQTKNDLAEGALFKLFMIAYLSFRLMLDFIKPGWRYLFGLGTIQLACIGGLMYYSPYLLRPKRFMLSKR